MNTKNIRLSVLDQSPVRKGVTAEQAVKETIELAKYTDQLGYTRFWVSEHHNTGSLAGSTPEVLMAHLAGQTKNIRIGSGGIMMPNHSALKVSENFRMLEALFPGRIDLGMGRAPVPTGLLLPYLILRTSSGNRILLNSCMTSPIIFTTGANQVHPKPG